MNRRIFLCTAAAAGLRTIARAQPSSVPDAIRNLRPMTGGIQPITDDERRARIEKARKLMRENKIGAVVMEGGSSAFYFTGSRSDGVFVLPSRGEILSLTREYKAIANALKDSGVAAGSVGIEERVHFDVVDGVSKLAPALEFTSCRSGDGRLPRDQIAG